jgi:hypothetical protein
MFTAGDRRATRRVLAWILFAFGTIFALLAVEGLRYELQGKRASAVVMTKAAGHGKGPQHFIFYRFTTPEGRTIDARSDVLPTTWRVLRDGGPVEIEYLPSSPETTRIPGQKARSWIFALMALAAFGGGRALRLRRAHEG